MRRRAWIAVAVAALGGAAAVGFTQMHGPMAGGHGLHRHDAGTMPGLKGANASEQESAELALLFAKFETLSRRVENLPNGIRTVTRSSDPEVMDALVSHAVGMIDRVRAKDDPQILIQSPTLDMFFLHGDEIVSEVEVTQEGLVVVQTSANPAVVQAMQVHAAEVTAMANRGMAAVHEMMAASGRAHHD